MSKIFEAVKKDLMYLAIIFIVAVIGFKILFYRESFFAVLRMVAAFYWLFILPGFFLLNYWSKELSFIERFIISVPFNAAIVGIASYYLGLLGLNIKYHTTVLPIVILVVTFIILTRKKE